MVGGEEPGRPVADEPGVNVTGEIIRGKTVRLGYLHQGDAGLDPALTPREAVTQVRGTLDSAQGAAAASQLLDRLGLRGDTQWTPAGELSGGERRRLQLLRILVDEPNVLFLDEPTNDLDVDTLTELEDLLDGWPGSLVLVSHDRYFLERVTDHVVALLGDGSLSFLPGGVEEYLAGARAAARAGTGGPAGRRAPGRGGRRRRRPRRPGRRRRGAQRAARKDMARLERQIDRLTTQENKLTAALAEHAADYVRLTELGAELRAVQDEKARLEEQWLEAAETGGRDWVAQALPWATAPRLAVSTGARCWSAGGASVAGGAPRRRNGRRESGFGCARELTAARSTGASATLSGHQPIPAQGHALDPPAERHEVTPSRAPVRPRGRARRARTRHPRRVGTLSPCGGARRPAGRAGPGAGRPGSGGRSRSARSAARARCAGGRPGPRRPGPPRPRSA